MQVVKPAASEEQVVLVGTGAEVHTAIEAFRQAVLTLTNYEFETRMGPAVGGV